MTAALLRYHPAVVLKKVSKKVCSLLKTFVGNVFVSICGQEEILKYAGSFEDFQCTV